MNRSEQASTGGEGGRQAGCASGLTWAAL